MKEYELISLAQKSINAFIDSTFIDEKGEPIPNDGNPANPLVAFKNGLKIDDKDSIHYVIAKMLIALLGTAHLATLVGNEFYGVPKTDFKQFYQLQPQLKFFFQEPERQRLKRGAKNPKRMQFSVALRKNIDDIDEAYLKDLTAKINSAFPRPRHSNDLIFLGSSKYSYYAPDDGYQLKGIQAPNETMAISFIKSILSVTGTKFEQYRLTRTTRLGEVPNDSSTKKMVMGYVSLFKVVYVDPKNRDDIPLIYRPLLDLSDV